LIVRVRVNEWERKDFGSAEKITTTGSEQGKTSFWPTVDFSVRGLAKLS
jgi:hypothetical protein